MVHQLPEPLNWCIKLTITVVKWLPCLKHFGGFIPPLGYEPNFLLCRADFSGSRLWFQAHLWPQSSVHTTSPKALHSLFTQPSSFRHRPYITSPEDLSWLGASTTRILSPTFTMMRCITCHYYCFLYLCLSHWTLGPTRTGALCSLVHSRYPTTINPMNKGIRIIHGTKVRFSPCDST